MSLDGPPDAQQASDSVPSTPAMPRVPSSEVYRGTPQLLGYGFRHSLGWQDFRKVGPSFVVVRTGSYRLKVTQRFPLTERGWSLAWDALISRDPAAAEQIRAKLAKREVRSQAGAVYAALAAETLCLIGNVTFNGGTSMAPLARGQKCDLRFMSDRIMVCAVRSADAIIEMPYRDVKSVDVNSSDPSPAGAQLAAVILILILLGALLGLHIKGAPGAFVGALIAGAVGCLIGWAWSLSHVESNIRLLGRDAEYYFVDTMKSPEVMRRELSKALTAMTRARAAQRNEPDEATALASEPVPDLLSRLASLLQQGLLTRDEFDLLKARLIDQP